MSGQRKGEPVGDNEALRFLQTADLNRIFAQESTDEPPLAAPCRASAPSTKETFVCFFIAGDRGSTYGPRMPRPRPSAEKILAAAERTFARNGYAATSLRSLIQATGVSTTAFYARFDSKEAVVRALVESLLRDLAARAGTELATAKSLDEGFRRGVDVLVETIGARRELVRVALTEAAHPEVVSAVSELHATLAALLAAQVRALPLATTVDADGFGWALVGAIHMQVVRWAVYETLATQELAAALHAVAQPFLQSLAPVARKKKKGAA